MKTYFQTKFILINYPPKMLIKWWKWSPRISRKFIWRGLTIDIKTSVFSGSSFMPTFVTFNFETDGKSSFNQRYFYFYEKTLEKEYSIQSGNYVLNFYISSEMLLIKEVPINTSIQETINHSNTIVLVEPKKVEKTPILKVQDPDDVILFEYAKMPIYMNSHAYFEKENLIIDYWKLANDYEDEVFLTIEEPYLIKLYQEFDIKDKNKRALLNELLLEYEGDEDCFNKIIQFLEDKHILYDKRKIFH